jgi:WD40 repeat protein
MRAYANPIASHALQVYHSILATGPDCKLLNSMRSGQLVVPRLLSQRALEWSSAFDAIDGHTSSVNSVACSLDGARIVSGSDDYTVRIWDARTGTQLAVMDGHTDAVRCVAFSSDGAYIVSGSRDQNLRLWDAQTCMQLAELKGHSASSWMESVAFSPSGNYIISKDCHEPKLAWNITSLVPSHVQSLIYEFAHSSPEICSSMSVESPISRSPHTSTETLVWSEKSHWISWRRSEGACPVRLCWLPPERRGESFTWHDTMAIIGARQGIVTVLDFSDVIAMLKGVDQVSQY